MRDEKWYWQVGRFASTHFDIGGGFKYSEFSSLLGEDSHFDSYFSTGLVQPPTRLITLMTSLRTF